MQLMLIDLRFRSVAIVSVLVICLFSCKEDVDLQGCTDMSASNYDVSVIYNDGSCIYIGCTDSLMENYNPKATIDNGSCIDAREKFAGNFQVFTNCTKVPFLLSKNVSITYSKTNKDSISIANFTDRGTVVKGTVKGDSILIFEQLNPVYTFSGRGKFERESNSFSINYTYNASFVGIDSCKAVYSR